MQNETTERNNIICNALGESAWGFGMGLAAPLTVLPLLIERLGGGKLEIGLIAAIAAAGMLFPQIVSSFVLQRGVGRKRLLIIYHLGVILVPWAAMGVVLLLLPGRPVTARTLLLVLLGIYYGTIGFILPAWQDWLAGVFRPAVRGRAFAWSNLAAATGGAAAAFLAGLVASSARFPVGHAVLFFAGAGCFVISMVALAKVDDGSPPPPPRLPRRDVLARFAQSLTDGNFRRYLLSVLLVTAGGGSTAFFAVHYKSPQAGGLPDELVIMLGSAIPIAQALAGLALGYLGDRRGHKLGAAIGASAQLVALAAVAWIPGVWSCALAFTCVGVGFAGAWVSHQNLLFETCPHDCRMAHITVSNLVLAPLTVAVPILTGQAISRWGMTSSVGLCLIPTTLGLLWLMMVRDPRTTRT